MTMMTTHVPARTVFAARVSRLIETWRARRARKAAMERTIALLEKKTDRELEDLGLARGDIPEAAATGRTHF
ncbi:MAG: hypothetical protein ACPGID_13675 [Rubricella sp.]